MNDTRHARPTIVRRAIAAGQGRILLGLALVAALWATAGFFRAWTRVMVMNDGYRLSQAEARHRELLRDNEHLKMERATLRSAPRLEAVARSRLGMAPPGPSQVIALKPRPAPAPAPKAAVVAAQAQHASAASP
jgi:cell division protein FtsL